jgi:hypothetical protein
MTRALRHSLEARAEEYLRNGLVNQSLDTYRRLGSRRKYVARLRAAGNASLNQGDAELAISAFVIAGYLDLPARRRPKRAA